MSAYFLDKTKQKAVDPWMHKLFRLLAKMCINHMLEICANDESLSSSQSERVNTPAPSEQFASLM